MPETPGLGLLRQMRAAVRLAKLPVLMFTANAKREQIVQAVEPGVSGYIIKPFMAGSARPDVSAVAT